ncbi:MAG: methyltransferase domain-containing protein [Candidatus Coatesbacteria bacterium]
MTPGGHEAHLASLLEGIDKLGLLQAPWMRDALSRVPRHKFFDQYVEDDNSIAVIGPDGPTDDQLKKMYVDNALLIRDGPDRSSCSMPSLVVRMLNLLEIRPGMKVLEIGTGTGWNAGLLACGVEDPSLVYSIDNQPDLVENARRHLTDTGFPDVHLQAGDGGLGWPGAAPFDRIVVTAAAWDLPPAWGEQLAEEGILLMPFHCAGAGDPLLLLRKRDGRLRGQFIILTSFIPLLGTYGPDRAPASDIEIWKLTSAQKETALRLLAEVPAKDVKVAVPDPADLIFFIHAASPILRYEWLQQGEEWHCILHHEPSGAIARNVHWEQRLELHGIEAGVSELVRLVESWVAAGQPKIQDYRVELVSSSDVELRPGEWLERRAHGMLRITPPER